ncbi:MAG: hypothetical protein DHS20C14_12850 [Phycisphaeraceae bacterium]|nr:MAG: hypothetical protein DHS20C14_12850 [Phycisphaeraceae bacterium]
MDVRRGIRNGARTLAAAAVIGAGSAGPLGCSTAPKPQDQEMLTYQAGATRRWFERNVTGLDWQIERSAGYVVFPNIGQFGVFIAGGRFGRGMVCEPDGTQIGWAYINTASAGLQLGAQDFKMLVVFEDPATLGRFKADKLTGNVSAELVVADSAASGTASFTDGVAIYQGDNSGLMAGASVGLDLMRYKPLEAAH